MSKRLVWLGEGVTVPPFSREGRREAGYFLRMLQEGMPVTMPHARPMPIVRRGCLELRIQDTDNTWRIMCAVEEDAVIVLEIFPKKTGKTPKQVIETCKDRLARYQRDAS